MLSRASIFFFLCSPCFALADGGPTLAAKNPISLLPDGSVLQGVLLPRYDSARRLVGDLKVETMTLIDKERIQGKNVLMKFYNPDRSLRGKIFLENALFDQSRSRLSANEPVEITNDDLVAKGSGLIYDFQGGKGFLNGPVDTWIKSPLKTSMHMKTLPAAIAMLATSMLPVSLNAAPPSYVNEKELAAIKADAESLAPALAAASSSVSAELEEIQTASRNASEAARAFISGSKVTPVLDKKLADLPEPKPLQIQPGPDDTRIESTGGMYFDADAGVLVYLGNVKVTDPRFSLTGAEELKIFFSKKAGKKTEEPKKSGGLNLGGTGANFGDVQKLIATGAVRILQKGVGGKAAVEASGAILKYNIPAGEIIIHGGFPWVKQGDFYARAKEPDLTLRLLNDGSFSTEGNWEMGGNLNLKGR